MLKVTVDGVEVFVEKGSTVLQACEAVGVEIPRFCYHERLSIAGNCRMCLVEIEKTPKPVASCAMPIMNGMTIFTDTPLVKKAREAVLEFLLLNHPLDCPICDQGGECDLQDQALAFGSDRSRYFETKRGVEDKNCGPLIKTIMTRCIHCTRCVRFASEIAGVEDLGTTGRGRETEIGTYVEKTFESELSGNVIDLCPVGALTSKPYAFMARPWELRSTESIDVSDGVGSNIRIDSRGTEILRILPRFNEEINEEWISDKTRFSYDGLRIQRIDAPVNNEYANKSWEKEDIGCTWAYNCGPTRFLRSNIHVTEKDDRWCDEIWANKWKFEYLRCQWQEIFYLVYYVFANLRVQPSTIVGVVGDLVDSESALAFKEFLASKGSPHIFMDSSHSILADDLSGTYRFNTTIARLEEADVVLLIGVDTRHEASMINVRLRKRYLEGCFEIGSIGDDVHLTFPVNRLGFGIATLERVVRGRDSFCKHLAQAKNPVIICGSSIFERGSGSKNVVKLLSTLRNNIPNLVTSSWNGFNTLSNNCNDVGLQDIGIPKIGISHKNLPAKIDLVYLLGADNWDNSELHMHASCDSHVRNKHRVVLPKVIYIGHHGDKNAVAANIILPSAAFTEKRGFFTNTEGRPQETNPVLKAPGLAREDWKILSAMTLYLAQCPYSNYKRLGGHWFPKERVEKHGVPSIYKQNQCFDQLNSIDQNMRIRYNMSLKHNTYKESMVSTTLDEIRAKLQKVSPSIKNKGQVESSSFNSFTEKSQISFKRTFVPGISTFRSNISDFYLTNSITRSSRVMAKCSSEKKAKGRSF